MRTSLFPFAFPGVGASGVLFTAELCPPINHWIMFKVVEVMKIVTKGIALAAALMCLISTVPLAVSAEETGTADTSTPLVTSDTVAADSGYTSYHKDAPAPAVQAVSVRADSYVADRSAGVTPQADAQYGTVYQLEQNSTATFRVTVPTDAVYTLSVLFGNLVSTAENYEIGLKVDGAYPFDGCEKITFNVLWQDDGSVRELSNGDQVTPAQKQVEGINAAILKDMEGIVRDPYEFRLTAGTHEIAVTANERGFLLAGLDLGIPERVRSYAEVSADYGNYKKYEGEQIVLEGEAPYRKTDYALSSKSDPGSANVSPHDPERSLINYIGGDTWKEPGQEISWQFNAPEDGLYKLGFAFKQSTVTNGTVYRWLRIDGVTPFAEASEIGFSYDVGWQFLSFGGDGADGKSPEDYLVYLTAGPHTLSMEVTLSDVAEVFDRLEDIVASLGDLYLDIVMITSDSPDRNRDYTLHKQIPNFEERLRTNKEALDQLDSELGVTLQTNGELSGAVRNMSRILGDMLDSLYDAQLYVTTYYSAHQTLSAWLYDIKNMALSLDQIVLAAPDQDFDTPRSGAGERMLFSIRRFINSFKKTTTAVSSGDESMPTIKIWVNWGRDQVKVLNTLIQDTFTPQNNVNVKVEQVNASLVQGVISGNSPDLYLHMARTEPVNLAMRGVLYNLKNFSDYEDVLKNFQPGAETPYLYRNGCYALPDTQAFYVMFYRKDILDELNIEVPKTWDDFTQATGILQRNNMNTYLPYTKITAATTVNTGAGGLSIFPTMLMQKGGQMYNDDLTATALTSTESIKAFTFWTDFYTKYSLDQEANFFQKFRVGTMPLGITTYTQYLTFKVAAPEIDGKWAIAEIPGEVNADGTINNVCSGSGTGCSIMKSSTEKEAAWKFIKWWVSSDTQYRYSAECEAILGESGRTASATVDAISRLSWDSASLKVINAQWKNVQEIAEVPGSYFVSRSIDQAFWATKNGTKSCKEAIVDWSEICDKEVARKIAEYADKDPDGE